MHVQSFLQPYALFPPSPFCNHTRGTATAGNPLANSSLSQQHHSRNSHNHCSDNSHCFHTPDICSPGAVPDIIDNNAQSALFKTNKTQGSHSGRRNAARPRSVAMVSASFLQAFVRDSNFAICARKVFGGPFAKNSRSGARMSSKSSKRAAFDSIT